VRELNIGSMMLDFYIKSQVELGSWLVRDGHTT